MKTLALGSMVALALSSSMAFAAAPDPNTDSSADSKRDSFNFGTSVKPECKLGTSNKPSDFTLGQDYSYTFGDTWCNAKHILKLTSANGAMTQVSNSDTVTIETGSDDFGTQIGYTATLAGWGAPLVDLDVSSGVGHVVRTIEKDGAFRNDGLGTGSLNDTDGLKVTIKTKRPDQGPLLLAGDYGDTLILDLQLVQ